MFQKIALFLLISIAFLSISNQLHNYNGDIKDIDDVFEPLIVGFEKVRQIGENTINAIMPKDRTLDDNNVIDISYTLPEAETNKYEYNYAFMYLYYFECNDERFFAVRINATKGFIFKRNIDVFKIVASTDESYIDQIFEQSDAVDDRLIMIDDHAFFNLGNNYLIPKHISKSPYTMEEIESPNFSMEDNGYRGGR